jgi:hypothetical protein
MNKQAGIAVPLMFHVTVLDDNIAPITGQEPPLAPDAGTGVWGTGVWGTGVWVAGPEGTAGEGVTGVTGRTGLHQVGRQEKPALKG